MLCEISIPMLSLKCGTCCTLLFYVETEIMRCRQLILPGALVGECRYALLLCDLYFTFNFVLVILQLLVFRNIRGF